MKIKLNIDILQTYANLAIHKNDRFEIEFSTNVVKVKRCWVTTTTAGIQYSKIAVCTPKPTDVLRVQLLNFYSANTNNNLTVYVVVETISSPVTVISHLYATNDQEEYSSTLVASISSVSSTMIGYTELGFTEKF